MHCISRHFNKTRVDFYSIDVCYFSPHNGPLQAAVVWLFLCGNFRKGSFCPHERYFYEDEAGVPAAGVDGSAQRHLHAGELAVQHRGQPLRGPDQRAGHDGPLPRVPHPELRERRCHRLRHRHQRPCRPLPGRRRPRQGGRRRHPRHGPLGAPRHPLHAGSYRCHARLPGPVHRRRHHRLHGRDLLHHRLPVRHREHGQPRL